ncbi:MAG: glycerophosphodiester phosphodiesterase family protein [Candidatus Saccharimonadales bacterium]
MAVAFRSQGATAATNGTTLTLAMPSGVQSGDYLIAYIHNQNSGSTADISSSGWTRINAAFTASDFATRTTGMYAKFAGGSEPSDYSFTIPTTGTRSMGFIAAYTGVDTGSPVYFASAYSKSSSAGTTLNVAADTTPDGHFTIELWAANYASPNSYALSSYTGGLTLLGSAYNPAGAENTGVSRSALMVWQGNAGSGGIPAHVVTTTGQAAHMNASIVSLNPAGGGGGIVTTPTIVGHTTSTGSGSSSSFTLDPDVNRTGFSIGTGDWILVVFTSASGISNTRQPTPPAGWTNLVPFATVGSGSMSFGVWAHKRVGGESTYAWTQTTAEANNTFSRMIFVRGADDIAHWITGTFQNRATSGTTTTNIAPSITAVSDHTLALLLSGERTVAAESDAQVTCDNFTKGWFENNADNTLFVANKDMVTAGATGSVTVTYPNSHAQNGIAGIIGIPGTVSSTIGLPIKVSTGSDLTDATFQLANGAGGFITPGAYKVVRPGYATITQMLAQPMFYCAHRGGSRDYPEMSLYAYGQSALRGYGAVELSLARSSDGVWFGLHDASLDRTSFNTGGGSGTTYVASSMTWAQIQTYNILGSMAANNPTQANRPYMRWEELMALYYGTHVIFVDPKVAISYRTEILNMMDAMPGTPTDHFVAKYYGVSGGAGNTSGWAFDAAARGYKSWGYFYQADVPSLPTYAGRWDILGMDYGADSTSWTAVQSYGKPVMAHILPNPAAFTIANNYGANGVMVSGVGNITPAAIV